MRPWAGFDPWRPRRAHPMRPAFILLLIAIILLSGCNDDGEPTPASPSAFGVIEGTITAGGEPVASAVVQAYPHNGDDELSTTTGADGRYSLVVPKGAYYLAVESLTNRRRVPVYFTDSPPGLAWKRLGSIQVEGKVEVGFAAGRLVVRIPIPPILEREQIMVRLNELRAPASIFPRTSAGAVAQGGVLEAVFPLLPPGRYLIELETSGGARTWLPGSAEADTSTAILLDASVPGRAEIRLSACGTIQGTYRGAWQTMGLLPPELHAFDADRRLAAVTDVSEDGFFSLGMVCARPVRLLARFEAGRQKSWIGGETFEEATVFDAAPGQDRTGIEILESGIEARIEMPGLLSDRWIDFQLYDERDRMVIEGQSGSATNPLQIAGLGRGAYRLYIFPFWRNAPFLAHWYDGAASLQTATPIVIDPGLAMARITVRLVEGGKILGRLRPADGVETEEHDVVHALVGEDPEFVTRTARWTGAFEIRGLEDGEYQVGVGVGGDLYWYPGTFDRVQAGEISIRDHGVVQGIEWPLPE